MDMLMQSLPDLGIELEIPDGWSVAPSEDASVSYLAPEEQGYRTIVSLSADRLDPPTPARFEEIIGDVPQALSQRHDDLEVITQQRYAQAGLPAWLIRYRWQPADHDDPFEQVMVLLVVSPEHGHVVQIDASTITPLATSHLPVVQSILGSIRAV